MKLAIISMMFAIVMVVSSLSVIGANNNEKEVYPTITIYTSDGVMQNITGKAWSGTIFPYIEGRIKSFDWTKKIKYLFFDKSLKGLNPYGLDFVRAIEKSTSTEFEANIYLVLSKALNDTANLDSDHDGYTNQKELNSGSYPGFADDYPGKNSQSSIEDYEGYITISAIIGATFVLYFVFNREKEKS